MEATCVMKTLEYAGQHLSEHNAVLPQYMRLNADNTAREAKNTHFATFCSWLVSTSKFDAWDVEFPKSGHSHNEQDQRFSSCATCLAAAPILESPRKFCEWLEANLKPIGGRKVHVEILEGCMDFQKWFVPYGIQLAGHCPTTVEEDVCHHWRFVKRRDINCPYEYASIQTTHPEWQDLPEDDDDVILLTKESISMTKLSQNPVLMLPNNIMHSIRKNWELKKRCKLCKFQPDGIPVVA